MGYQLWVSPNTGYRRNGTRFTALKNIFIDNVTVKDIYEPLLCCRIDQSSREVKETLEYRQFDIAGVLDHSEKVVGYIETSSLNDGTVREHLKPIQLTDVISDSTPLANLLNVLREKEYLYIIHAAKVVGIITRADIDKPPVRVYVFGMLSLLEMHLNSWIKHHYKEDGWHSSISDNRLTSAKEIYEKRKGNNQDLTLLDCLQLADKRDILAKTEAFRNSYGFSRRDFEKLLKTVETIRNELAHSQDSIIENVAWDEFTNTLEKVETFLVTSDQNIEILAREHSNDYIEYLTTSA